MVNAQEFINKNFSDKSIKQLTVVRKNLEGELDLSEFTELEELNCVLNKLTNLKINNCLKLTRLSCGANQLTNLDLTGLNELETVNCNDNYFTSFDYSSLNPEKLTHLNISDNNLAEQNLNVFSKFTNLEHLYIGNEGEKILWGVDNSNQERWANNIYNKFTGSLEPLKNLNKLIILHIANTDINEGLEYLINIQRIYCSSEERSVSKVKSIETLLGNSIRFVKSDNKYIKKQIHNNPKEYLNNNYSDKENTKKIELFSDTLQFAEKGELVISDYPNLKEIVACYGKVTDNIQIINITQVIINNCPQLKTINVTGFVDNQELVINNCPNLERLYCGKNQLTNFDFLTSLNPDKLAELSLSDNNFSKQNLEIFTPFVGLRALYIAGLNKPSYFAGSLKPLQKLEKLEILDIGGTDITHGLEYLPESVKSFNCKTTRPNAQVTDISEELQAFGEDINKWREVKLEKKDYLLTSSLLPPQLIGENKQKSKFVKLVEQVQRQNRENKLLANISELNYKEIHFNNWPRNNKVEISSSEQLPTRLYNIKESKVEETKGDSNIKKYAILSYVWGSPNIKATFEMEKEEWWKENLTVSGNKSLRKAIKTCNLLGVNHVWIDQLCIIQDGEEAIKDKENEIPKMRQYYTNAEVTLIALNDEIGDISDVDPINVLKKIVDSEWFERSWTFQEGWLSKQTVFMFDDYLTDGRYIAGIWALNQASYTNVGKYNSLYEFNKGTKKIATPLGWTYYRNGYDENDKVEMTLSQTLKEIKSRKRFLPIDGIYSILGLLPYGKEVKVRYSKNNTPELALRKVMQIAVKHGYAEPLSWLGISNPNKGLCWMPQIDEQGSTSIVGSVGKVDSIQKSAGIASTATGIKEPSIYLYPLALVFSSQMPHYVIQEIKKEIIHKLESGFEIEGGLYKKEIIVKSRDNEEESFPISLLGTQESLNQATENNILVVLNERQFGTNKLLALLVVKESEQQYMYRRLGLVELVDNNERIKPVEGANPTFITNGIQYQAQIEIPPK